MPDHYMHDDAPMESDDSMDLDSTHRMLKDWFDDWELATQDARKDSERDRDYYDGIQWTREEIAELENRSQPIVTKNRIFKKINFLIGTEIENRSDPKALPRTMQHDDDSEAITDALRYVADAEDLDNVASQVWENMLIEGYGGAIVEHEIVSEEKPLASNVRPIQGGMEISEVGEVKRRIEVKLRHVEWDRLWYDIHSRKADFSDATHYGITRWWDLEDAINFYSTRPNAVENFEEVLREALTHANTTEGDTHDDKPRGAVWSQVQNKRKRIRTTETFWWREGQCYVAHLTASGFLENPKPTGYLDEKGYNVCPLLMTAAFATRDGMRYGLVRHMISAQDEINKRSSKALHRISVDRVTAEEGAVINPDEAQTERAKPDGWVTVERDALVNGRIQFESGLNAVQGDLQLLAEAKQEIDTIGPEIPAIGSVGAGSSGRALQIRQQIGSLELSRVNDNHKRWRRGMFRQIWFRIRQFWADEKWLRIRDDSDRKGYRFVGLNRRMSRMQRFMEIVQEGVDPVKALESVMPVPQARMMATQILQQAQQMVQAQMQQIQAQVQAQGGDPSQIPQPDESMIQQIALQLLQQTPVMQEPITMNDVAGLDVDIVLSETPDSAIVQMEEFESLTSFMPTVINAHPQLAPTLVELVIEASQLRSKKKLLDILRNPPEDAQAQAQQQMMEQQQQMQQMMAQVQMQVAQSQAMLNQAKAAEAQAKAQTIIPVATAEVENTQADTEVKHAKATHETIGAAEKLA